MLTSTKRLELLAYGARGERGDRSAAKTAAEMAAAVNAGRAHNRLVGYAGQPRDTLEPRHVKGTLTLMLTVGAQPVAAELHLLYADGEPRYTILGTPCFIRWTHAMCSALEPLTPHSCSRRPSAAHGGDVTLRRFFATSSTLGGRRAVRLFPQAAPEPSAEPFDESITAQIAV